MKGHPIPNEPIETNPWAQPPQLAAHQSENAIGYDKPNQTENKTENKMKMKNTIAIAILAFAGLILHTPCPSQAQDKTKTGAENIEDSFIMKNGKMMMMKVGKMMEMGADVVLENGTKVMQDGTVIMKSGEKMMMKNGDRITAAGKMWKEMWMRDHLMMSDGKMMVMKNGKATPMEEDMTFDNGTKVMRDGSVTMKDGKTAKMTDGDRLSMDGQRMKD